MDGSKGRREEGREEEFVAVVAEGWGWVRSLCAERVRVGRIYQHYAQTFHAPTSQKTRLTAASSFMSSDK